LGFEPWQRPVGIKSSNSSLRFDYTLDDDWRLRMAGGHSRSAIDDNVAFAYGASTHPTAPAAPRRDTSSPRTATTTSTTSAAPTTPASATRRAPCLKAMSIRAH